ncbi:MAG: tRNA threonylcarbamoyladenosine dehydratase [Ruminococcaceae bacterium]|nr:tRNA threonylcarbamoyladenosine dehydratase [Oscillospiraceae bacterium]
MIPEIFEREALLIGEENLKRLMNSSVMVFGAGGVGSFVIEGLVRGGIGHIIAVDNDVVSITNINRQLIADTTTVGVAKTEAARSRAIKINPAIDFVCERVFVTPDNAGELIKRHMPDYIVDAIDTVSAKIAIIECADKLGIKIISSMGTGNKLEPERLKIADIYATSVCPLARVMRKELKDRGIKRLSVLYSDEEPIKRADGSAPVIKDNGRNAPGSISFVPSAGGLIIASKVVRDLILTKK